MISPLSPEFCITQALAQINQAAFPTFSDSFLDQSSPLADIRQDFVFACTRHGLLPATIVETLLGDGLMETPPTPASRYTQEDLFTQCLNDAEKIEGYIEELEKADGNGGAIARAITQVIGNFCATKETMSLQRLCNALSCRPKGMDVMMQFTSPISILQPLCNLLDGWRYEDDQGTC
jgi:mediator of RNA polymerase II transcription subunit 5